VSRNLDARERDQRALRNGLCDAAELFGTDFAGLEIVPELFDFREDLLPLVSRKPGLFDEFLSGDICKIRSPTLPLHGYIDAAKDDTQENDSENDQEYLEYSTTIAAEPCHIPPPFYSPPLRPEDELYNRPV
jgi:hypothetical protein